MAQFLDVAGFSAMFRDLTDAETEVATLLLEVAESWVRTQKPGVADDDPAAKFVVYEVVANAITYGKYRGLSEWLRTTGHKTESGTRDVALKALDFTDEMRQQLGIPLRAGPAYQFFENDFATRADGCWGVGFWPGGMGFDC